MRVYGAISAIQFAELCAGKQVTLVGTGQNGSHPHIELILSDIGFAVMEDAIARARHRAEAMCPNCPHPAHPGVSCRTSDCCDCGQ
jgi:hypothetical protein